MPSVVYCDNKDCIFYDDCRGCDVDRLVIERGVCVGSTLHGRNVSENDLDEQLKTENEKLRAECARYESLIGILERDWGVEASWDGLRKFWHVGLNDTGTRKRDESETENAELRYKVHVLEGGNKELKILYDSVKANNAKLRELLVKAVKVADNYYRGFGFMNDIDAIKSEMRGLGIEVE